MNTLNMKTELFRPLIEEFNSFPGLQKIETEEQVIEFVTLPYDYFDKHILSDLGIATAGHREITPEQIADIVGIPYVQFCRQIGGVLLSMKTTISNGQSGSSV